jgi:ABC-type multidrug transport system fused ATPase/permease subunit
VKQTGVALNRIAVYLDEEEVTDQVSILKKDYSEPHLLGVDDGELGLENATFKWNEVADHVEEDGDKGKSNGGPPSPSMVNETGPPVGDNSSKRSMKMIAFELRDISVRFPPGELTVVTGPTASGKTALLVGYL